MQYFEVQEFKNLPYIRTAIIPKDIARFRLFSYDNRDDLKYYADLANDFGVTINDMVRLPQKHTDNIRFVTKDVSREGVVRMEKCGGFDAAITNEKGIMLCTIEADCTPVFLVDTKNIAIGMVHSGWRGTVSEITLKTIKEMNKHFGTQNNDLLIHFGPAICGNCYEVDSELIDEFKKILSNENINKVFRWSNEKNKYLLDVTLALKLNLLNNGIKENQISRSKYCTYHDNIFSSWRRDKDKTNQMLTTIMIK